MNDKALRVTLLAVNIAIRPGLPMSILVQNGDTIRHYDISKAALFFRGVAMDVPTLVHNFKRQEIDHHYVFLHFDENGDVTQAAFSYDERKESK